MQAEGISIHLASVVSSDGSQVVFFYDLGMGVDWFAGPVESPST